MDQKRVQNANNVTMHIRTKTVVTSSVLRLNLFCVLHANDEKHVSGNFADCNENSHPFSELLVRMVPIKSVVSALPLVLIVKNMRVKTIIRRFQGITVPTSRCPKHLFQWGNCGF